MQLASQVKVETQYGNKITPAQPADWLSVRQHALMLAERTRDLRVSVYLIRAAAQTDGFESAVQGLRLLGGLIETQWDAVFPLLDASDNNDPTARVSALTPLGHAAGLTDFRAATLTTARGSIKVRDLELAFGRAEPLPGEPVPTQDGLLPAVVAAQAQSPKLAAAMADAVEVVRAMSKVLDDKLGGGVAPDLSPLVKLLQAVADAGRAAQPRPSAAAGTAAVENVAAAAAARPSGSIESRDDAIRTLQRVSDWIELHEPSNPAPLLIQRAQRLMTKNFLEIIKDLVPDGLVQIEKLAGPGHQ
jgi:type VI secretion system protein ImpA